MKRGAASLFSPRTMRMLALGLAIVIVLYTLTRVYEGFQCGGDEVTFNLSTIMATTSAGQVAPVDALMARNDYKSSGMTGGNKIFVISSDKLKKGNINTVEMYIHKGCLTGLTGTPSTDYVNIATDDTIPLTSRNGVITKLSTKAIALEGGRKTTQVNSKTKKKEDVLAFSPLPPTATKSSSYPLALQVKGIELANLPSTILNLDAPTCNKDTSVKFVFTNTYG